ncbi:hypothetical protein [Paraclostridium bifermentans]|uniref:hypothetical protein n=1 Tax=Paraclostridium bifermentans TaxID=1490 RepID=UPI00359C3B20
MVLVDRTYLRNYEIAVQEDLNKNINVETQSKDSKKVKRKKGKNPDNNIYRDLKSKISIVNKSQKNIKEKLAQVQVHEDKVNEMEATLKEIQSAYQQAVKEGKQEQIKEKIKIKKILKETNDLGHEYNAELHSSHEECTIDTIGEALRNIQNIKYKLSEYKSKLLDIEKYVNRTKKEYETKEKIIKKHIESEEYINEKVLINPLDFIFVEGNLDIGVVINIFV